MEILGGSGRRNKYVSRSAIQRLKRGGKIADQIKQESNQHHQSVDIPNAEKMLDETIESAYQSATPPNHQNSLEQKRNKSLLEKIQDFIKRLFYPSSS